MTEEVKEQLREWAEEYNSPKYFETDPIAFPRKFALEGASLQDIEIAAVFSALFAWGRRAMIVRDCERLFDFMEWKPYDYVMSGCWRSDAASIHRTVKWADTALICRNLRDFYKTSYSLEGLGTEGLREKIYGQKRDPSAPNKKISMLRRWLVRDDGRVDLGLWKNTSKRELLIPLDVHVYSQATALGLTTRKSHNLLTAKEITDSFKELFPDDPVKGDFALFGYGVNNA